MIEVRRGGRRRIDRVLDSPYVHQLDALELAELRRRRDEASQEETDLSYLRRLLHARIDIVLAEQHHRASDRGAAEEPGERHGVLDRLATILSENALAPAAGQGRYQPLEPSRAGVYRREAEALAGNSDLSDVTTLDDDALETALRNYREGEESVSARRREVQAVVDTLNAELTKRYASGSASVDELIGEQRAGGARAGAGEDDF